MFYPLEFYIGSRYTRAQRRNHFISFISLISMMGIALGVTALITVLSVMNGFEKELRQRILGVVSHATVTGYGGALQDWQGIMEKVQDNAEVVGSAPYVEGEGMFYAGDQVSGALLRGIDPALEPSVSDLKTTIVRGQLTDLSAGSFNVILGSALAQALGVGVGDKVTLIVPQTLVTPAGILPRLKRFTVAGIFEAGMYQYDSALALINIADAAKLLRLENEVSGVRLKLTNMMAAPAVSRQLNHELGINYFVTDWTRQHSNYFRAVQMEKTVMFIILLLIVAVAAFNIVSTLVMVVTDKRSDIAILRTLGASPRSILGIFMIQGTLIGVVGTLLGATGGVALALNVAALVQTIEHVFGVVFLDPSVYYISEVPSDLRWPDVFKITVTSFVISLSATLYPAWRAARTQPAEALRYE